jgi:hypothetical protein
MRLCQERSARSGNNNNSKEPGGAHCKHPAAEASNKIALTRSRSILYCVKCLAASQKAGVVPHIAVVGPCPVKAADRRLVRRARRPIQAQMQTPAKQVFHANLVAASDRNEVCWAVAPSCGVGVDLKAQTAAAEQTEASV